MPSNCLSGRMSPLPWKEASAESFRDQTLFCKNLKFHCHTSFLKTNIKPQLPVVNPWWRRMKKAVMWGQQCLLSRAVYPHQSCCCHMSPVLTPQKILSAAFTQMLGKVTRLRLYQRKIWIHLNRTCFFIYLWPPLPPAKPTAICRKYPHHHYSSIEAEGIPDICHFFYTHTFWVMKILHSESA